MTERTVIFAGGRDGSGDAINVGRDSYAWSMGFDCRHGRAVPTPGPYSIDIAATAWGYRWVSAFEWPLGRNSSSEPVVLVASGSKAGATRVLELANGAMSGNELVTVPISPLAPGYTGGALYRNGDTETAYWCFGALGGTGFRVRSQAGVYSSPANATNAEATMLALVGADLWRVRTDGYSLQKLIADADPTNENSWSTIEAPVGLPSYPINKVLELGGSPIALSGLGVFKYNPSSQRFDNLTPIVPAHPDNGKGGFADGRGRIYYPTVTGRLLVISFGTQSQEAPLRQNEIDRDTPFGRISLMSADEEYVYASIEPGGDTTEGLGLTVYDDLNGFSTGLVNNDLGTRTSWSAITTSQYIYIGATEPFWGVHFTLGQTAYSTATGFNFTAEHSNGSGGWAQVTIKDSTNMMQENGLIAILPTTDIYASGTWGQNTVSGTARYWIRLLATGTGATTPLTGVEVAEVRIVPYRPPIDADLFMDTAFVLAGTLPRIKVGQWRGEHIVWHDWLTLRSENPQQMLVSQVTAPNTVGNQTLYAICGQTVEYCPIGHDGDPLHSAYPKTNGLPHFIAFSGNDFGMRTNLKTVEKFVVQGEHLQSADSVYIFTRWDTGRWERHGPYSHYPVVIENIPGKGRILYSCLGLIDAARNAVCADIEYAEVPEDDWTDLGPVLEGVPEDISSPRVN